MQETTEQTAASSPDAASPIRPVRPYVNREGASRYLMDTWGMSFTAGTLAKFACTGRGPHFLKAGRRAVYSPDELDCWARARLRDPEQDASGPA